MRKPSGVGEDSWSVWLARRGAGAWEYRFSGGPVENPQQWPVQGVYRTREEARAFRSEHRDWLSGNVLVPPLYEEPIAFAVLRRAPSSARWSGAAYYVTPCRGGPVPHADSDIVVAVFRREEDARAYAGDVVKEP